MKTTIVSRRKFLRTAFVGSVLVTTTACGAIQRLPRGSTGGSTDGKELSMAVKKALRQNAFTSQLALDIRSNGDEVIIKGFVNNEQDVANVSTVANQVNGVRHALVDLHVRK